MLKYALFLNFLILLKKNKKIIVFVTISFVISFLVFFSTLFYLAMDSSLTSEELNFYSEFPDGKELIFLIGSSHVLPLNATYITESILDKASNHIVYNLGKPSDLPKQRIDSIDYIIKSKPDLVLYGIGFRDIQKVPEGGFGTLIIKEGNSIQKRFIDPQTEFEKILYKIGFYKIDLEFLQNPKFQILTKFKKIFEKEIEESHEVNYKQFPNTPFYKEKSPRFEANLKKASIEEIGTCSIKDFELEVFYKDRNLVSLETMIEKFKENNIRVILFSTPLHKNCFEKGSDSANRVFENTMMEISEKHDIEFYPLHDAYWDYELWTDQDHLTFQNSFQYSDDIAQIILKGIR